VRRNPSNGNKDEQFWQKALNALAKCPLGSLLQHKGLAEFPQLVLKGVLLRHAKALLHAW